MEITLKDGIISTPSKYTGVGPSVAVSATTFNGTVIYLADQELRTTTPYLIPQAIELVGNQARLTGAAYNYSNIQNGTVKIATISVISFEIRDENPFDEGKNSIIRSCRVSHLTLPSAIQTQVGAPAIPKPASVPVASADALVTRITTNPSLDMRLAQIIFAYGSWHRGSTDNNTPFTSMRDLGLTDGQRIKFSRTLEALGMVPTWRYSRELRCNSFRLTGSELVDRIDNLAEILIRSLTWRSTPQGLNYVVSEHMSDEQKAAVKNALTTREILFAERTHNSEGDCIVIAADSDNTEKFREIIESGRSPNPSSPGLLHDGDTRVIIRPNGALTGLVT